MMATAAGQDEAPRSQVIRKVTVRLMPLLIALYVVNFIDRVNIGIAALRMNADLGLTATTYGLAAGIFFIGYLLFQMPANRVFHRVGMRRWLPALLAAWGLCSAATAAVTGPVTLCAARLVLGVAEAGFYPAVICYLGYWYPRACQARAVAAFLLAVPLANMIGTPLSSLLVAHGAIGGMAGWRVMFLAEGLPAVLLALAARALPDGPHEAAWLTRTERAWLAGQLAAERPAAGRQAGFRATVTDPRVLVLAAVNAGLYFALYAVQFFLPQIASGCGSMHLSPRWAGSSRRAMPSPRSS